MPPAFSQPSSAEVSVLATNWTIPLPCARHGAMRETIEPPKPPRPAKQDGRSRRLAEALRANLARRKAKKRARTAPDDDTDAGGQDDGQQG